MKPDDGLPDDRVTCGTCRHCDARSFRCNRYKTSALIDLPLRCPAYYPVRAEIDQRPGTERWPTLKKELEDARMEAGAKSRT